MFKRVCAVALAVVMVLALASCGKRESKTIAVFKGISQETGYHIDLEMELEGEMIRMNVQGKDELFYADATISGEEVLMIRNADGFYLLLPSMMMGMKLIDASEMDDAIEAISMIMIIGEEAEGEKFKAGEMEVDGTTYYFEEFEGEGEDGNVRFLFEGEEMRYILSMDGDEIEEKMKIYSIDTEIDEDLFKIPKGYVITEGDL